MTKISREKQLTIALLKEKIEKATGKKVVFEESKEDKLKRLVEKLEKLTGKKVVFESEEVEETQEELEEGLFGKKSDAEFQKEYQTTINLWVRKGYKQPDINAIMAAAKADKFEGKLGVDKEKNIIYRPAKDIKWSSQFAGGGTGTASGGTTGA